MRREGNACAHVQDSDTPFAPRTNAGISKCTQLNPLHPGHSDAPGGGDPHMKKPRESTWALVLALFPSAVWTTRATPNTGAIGAFCCKLQLANIPIESVQCPFYYRHAEYSRWRARVAGRLRGLLLASDLYPWPTPAPS